MDKGQYTESGYFIRYRLQRPLPLFILRFRQKIACYMAWHNNTKMGIGFQMEQTIEVDQIYYLIRLFQPYSKTFAVFLFQPCWRTKACIKAIKASTPSAGIAL